MLDAHDESNHILSCQLEKACQQLWLFYRYGVFAEVRVVLALPTILVPLHLVASRCSSASRRGTSQWLWEHCRRALDGSLPCRLSSQDTADGTAGLTVADEPLQTIRRATLQVALGSDNVHYAI